MHSAESVRDATTTPMLNPTTHQVVYICGLTNLLLKRGMKERASTCTSDVHVNELWASPPLRLSAQDFTTVCSSTLSALFNSSDIVAIAMMQFPSCTWYRLGAASASKCPRPKWAADCPGFSHVNNVAENGQLRAPACITGSGPSLLLKVERSIFSLTFVS